MAEEKIKSICLNKKAHFNYFLSDYLEAGLELKGTEIKSIRAHNVSTILMWFLKTMRRLF